MTILRRFAAAVMTLALCLTVAACTQENSPGKTTAPTRPNKPILPGYSDTTPSVNDYTAVYVTVFDDLAILASYPVLKNPNPNADPEKLDPLCPPRELSDGGSILCGDPHEDEFPITRVLITGDLVPKSMAGWFRDMVHLRQIDGLEKIRTHHVTDMNHLFAGCQNLSEIRADGWDVSNVQDMTAIFEGCDAMETKPAWYTAEEEPPLD